MQQLSHLKREKLYWLSQLFGWLGFFIIQTAIPSYFAAFGWQVIAGYLNITVIGFILTHLYRGYIKRKRWLNLSLQNLAIRIFLASVLIAMLWAVIVLPINAYYFPMEEDKPLTLGIVVVITMNLSVVILSWSMIYFIFQLFVNY